MLDNFLDKTLLCDDPSTPASSWLFVTHLRQSYISRERFDLESQNFTRIFTPVGSSATPDMTSLATSGWRLLHKTGFDYNSCHSPWGRSFKKSTDCHAIVFLTDENVDSCFASILVHMILLINLIHRQLVLL